jgi:hypothetical protein
MGTGGVGPWCSCAGDCQSGCSTGTPLCFSFHDQPIHFTDVPGHFKVREETSSTTDWIGSETPWLTLDRDGDGRIDDGRELFGSMTVLPNGRLAVNGFEALRALDSNGDGRITPADAAWSRLRLWSDVNQDRISQPSELTTLASRGIEALSFDFGVARRCDLRGNCEVERATFWYRSHGRLRRGSLVDVHLAAQPSSRSVAAAGSGTAVQ